MQAITPLNRRANLIKLANYFKRHKKLQAGFDMYDFTDYKHRSENTCGTVGCAIGHGPHAGIPKTEKDWYSYSENFVSGCSTTAFEFMFGATWKYHDNTKIGVVRRIAYFLVNGVPLVFSLHTTDKYTRSMELYRGYENLLPPN
jgi:hypothetical protein